MTSLACPYSLLASVESAGLRQFPSAQRFRTKGFTAAPVRRFRVDFPLEVTNAKHRNPWPVDPKDQMSSPPLLSFRSGALLIASCVRRWFTATWFVDESHFVRRTWLVATEFRISRSARDWTSSFVRTYAFPWLYVPCVYRTSESRDPLEIHSPPPWGRVCLLACIYRLPNVYSIVLFREDVPNVLTVVSWAVPKASPSPLSIDFVMTSRVKSPALNTIIHRLLLSGSKDQMLSPPRPSWFHDGLWL